jgi:hypothetical protein
MPDWIRWIRNAYVKITELINNHMQMGIMEVIDKI